MGVSSRVARHAAFAAARRHSTITTVRAFLFRNTTGAKRIAGSGAPSHISPMFTIREARPDDADALVDVWLRSVRATHTFLSEEDIEFFLPLVRELMSSDQLELWVLASDANTLIGFMGLSGSGLEAMFLDPDHLRAGHGRRLVAHARGLKGALTVDVNEQNPAALHFYEACGFAVVGRSELDGTGRPFPLLHMRQRAELVEGPLHLVEITTDHESRE